MALPHVSMLESDVAAEDDLLRSAARPAATGLRWRNHAFASVLLSTIICFVVGACYKWAKGAPDTDSRTLVRRGYNELAHFAFLPSPSAYSHSGLLKPNSGRV